MKYVGFKRIFRNPFYVNFKKHYCYCGEQVEKIKVSRIVNSNSPEAKDFDFQNVDTFMIGNVKFIWTEFKCPKCGKQFTIDQMKEREKVL